MSVSVLESPEGRANGVRIEGLALMKIVKHCHDALPSMVSGSLLGLAAQGGIMEVTHAFPSPDSGKKGGDDDEIDEDYQMEMMRMLREVNVDNNCVGWYQSMYMGIYSTTNVLETQFSYQTDLSPNSVVLLYDPLQTAHGNFCLKAFRLSDDFLTLRNSGKNEYMEPSKIFEELPVTCTNPSLARAMLADYTPKSDITLDRLDMSSQPYLEKHLEYLCGWVDELAGEQQKFQYYTRQLARGNNKTKAGWNNPDAPSRMESLLVSNQIEKYCQQMDKHVAGGVGKLFMASGLHKDQRPSSK